MRDGISLMAGERNFYVLAYDITDNKRRTKVAKLCEALAERVQGSVFEGYLTLPELERLVKKAGRVMDAKEDSLRVYLLCAACRGKVAVHGVGRVTPKPGVAIV